MQHRDPYSSYNTTRSPFALLTPMLVMALVLIFAFYAVKGLLTILSFVAPILLLITFIVDREVIFGYGRWVGRLLKENTLVGIIAVILSIVGFHVVSGFLFLRALFRRQLKKAAGQAQQHQEGKYVDYEEVRDDESFLELPEVQPQPRRKDSGNDYEQLFD